MATLNDHFITEIELATLANIPTSSYTTKYATKSLATNSTFNSKITLLSATNSYKDTQFLEKKYVTKQNEKYKEGNVVINALPNLIQDLGYTDSNVSIKVYTQYKSDDDLNYYDSVFAQETPSFYTGMKGKIVYQSGSEYHFDANSTENSNNFYRNGTNVLVTNINVSTPFLVEPIFVLVLIFDGKDSSAQPVAYCVAEGTYAGENGYFGVGSKNRITKLVKITNTDKIPYRMYYDKSTTKWKCAFKDGSYGESPDYFYS